MAPVLGERGSVRGELGTVLGVLRRSHVGVPHIDVGDAGQIWIAIHVRGDDGVNVGVAGHG